MKATAFVSCAAMLCGASMVLAQSETRKPEDQNPDPQERSAQLAFARLKTLAGTWKGQGPEGPVRVSVRVTSGGDAVLHEMVPEGRSDDPSSGDNDPITMLYLEGDRLLLTHYCDSGKNRPRMVGKLSPDGKVVEFDFLDVSGGTKRGHTHHAGFTFVDADHHSEDWTYMTPRDKPMTAHMEFVRAK